MFSRYVYRSKMDNCIGYCTLTCRNWALAGREFCQSCLDRHYEYKAAFDAAKKAGQAEFVFEGAAACTLCAARYPTMKLHKCTIHPFGKTGVVLRR